MHKVYLIVLFVLALVHFSFSVDAKETPKAVLGKKVYQKACAACHGNLGDGKGPAAKYMDPKPRNFTLGTYKFRSTPSGDPPTKQDLVHTINKGLPGTRMPAFEGLLTPKEVDNVVAYLQTLSPEFMESGEGTPIKLPEPIANSGDLITEGKHLYMMMECYTCHGAKGEGDGKSALGMKDDQGRPISPLDFTKGPYRAGSDVKSIYKTINTGVTGTPMPAFADVFLFGGGDLDVSSYSGDYSDEWTQSLQRYFKSQPTDEQIEDMSDEEKEKLSERRKWALAYYVNSLSEKAGLFQRLFKADTENTH